MKSEVWGKTGLSKVKTQIRPLLQEQCDQGLHCLPFHLHHLVALLHCKIKLFHFWDNFGNYFKCPNFLIFRVFIFINPIALRTAKTPWSFGCSECNRVKDESLNVLFKPSVLQMHCFGFKYCKLSIVEFQQTYCSTEFVYRFYTNSFKLFLYIYAHM